ncbi:hypothetical protein SAMN05443634_109161 [Chishuiella changwenlii]|uniref:Uncharacterized protein n=1 Tax=Chishuiella changwenlii TaxID=1434701 RepID=A0A1M7AU42_9FLAO|nr:hypothetical protein [Chishuiella changwenlii]GGE91313.1 hypothetical protein GCM10010984_06320 [Chishuiella changwenlii]SHL46253.1 hypothetical protein SAMN05443634_109161 [Chishuiella changwenlii]
MFKQLLLTASLAFSTFSYAQVTSMINDKNSDASTKVYGMAFLTDATKANEKYNFILENQAAIQFAKPLLEYGFQASNAQAEENGLMIYVVKDKKVVDQWLANPTFYNVFHDGIPYSFNADNLAVLADKYPLIYKEEKRQYKNEKEYKKERDALYRDPYNLIIVEPDFTYEGYFEIQFPKNEQFKNTEAIDAYLRPLIEKNSKKKFDINYALSEKNILDRNQFTMTIVSEENVYKKLKLDNLEKGAWQTLPYEAYIYKKNN